MTWAEGGLLGGKVAPAQTGDDVVPDEQAESPRRVGVQQRHPGAGDGAGAREVEQERAGAQSTAGPDERDDAGARRVLGAQQGGDEAVGAVGRRERLQCKSVQAAPAQVLDGSACEHVRTAQEEDGIGRLHDLIDDVGQVLHGAQHRVAAGTGAHEGEDVLDPGLGQGGGQRLPQGIGRGRTRRECSGRVVRGGWVGRNRAYRGGEARRSSRDCRSGRRGGLGRVVRYDKGDRVGAARQHGGNDGVGPGEGLSLSGGVGPDGGGRPGHDDEDTNTGCRWRLIGDRRRRRSGHSRYSRHGPPGRRRPCWARRNRCGPGTRCIQEDRRCGRVGHGSSLERE